MENKAANDDDNVSVVSVESINNVASWVSTTVISAFFNSLERFSCVNIQTTDIDEDDDEGDVRPLRILSTSSRDSVDELPV
ncbi:hypothetical protein LINPERPRIM_LOCUS24326 [Linum perenne]